MNFITKNEKKLWHLAMKNKFRRCCDLKNGRQRKENFGTSLINL